MENFKPLIAAFIPSMIVTIVGNYVNKYQLKQQIITFVVVFLVFYIIVFVINFVKDGFLAANVKLFTKGKIKGLWAKKGLIGQIKMGFKESDNIKIKVTRGIDLFNKEDVYGFVPYMKDIQSGSRKVHMQFLLITPCFKESHVRIRKERHTQLRNDEFLETWYESVQKMKEYSNNNLSIAVKFYTGGHARWRYYIFSKNNGEKAKVFLAHYDKNTSGSEQPMYKIIKKAPNIASFMTDYFDDLWNEAISPAQLYSKISNGSCMNRRCAYDVSGLPCQNASCEYSDTCKKLIKKYENVLTGF